MKVLIVEPWKDPYVKDIDGKLETLQKIVGGYIEVVYPHDDESCIICNEDGKFLELDYNREIRDKQGKLLHIIVGTFIVCNAPKDSEDFDSLTDEQVAFYKNKYILPSFCFTVAVTDIM